MFSIRHNFISHGGNLKYDYNVINVMSLLYIPNRAGEGKETKTEKEKTTHEQIIKSQPNEYSQSEFTGANTIQVK